MPQFLDRVAYRAYIHAVQCLYSHRIPNYVIDTASARCMRMLKAYLLGDTLEDNGFVLGVRREIVDTASEGGLRYEAINFAYKNTQAMCTRRFLVDLYTLTGNAQWLKEERISTLFLVDMSQSSQARAVLQRKRSMLGQC